MVEKYCFECHNRDDLAGDRAFDRMSPDRIAADAETWELAIRKLRGGLMPPAGGPRPDGETVARARGVARGRDRFGGRRAAARACLVAPPEPPRVRARGPRSARARGRPGALLPDDNVEGYFDNNADALQVSPAFVNQYIDAARAIALEAVGDANALPIATQLRRRGEHGDLAAGRRRSGHGPAAASPARHAVRHARRLHRQAQLPGGRRVRAHDRRHGARARSAAHGVREHGGGVARRQGALSHERSAAKPITRRSIRRSIRPSRRSTGGCARSASRPRPASTSSR